MADVEHAPEYLVIGHITADVVADGTTPGGTALYAALTAARLGLRTAVVTSAPPAYLETLTPHLAGASTHVVEHQSAIIMANLRALLDGAGGNDLAIKNPEVLEQWHARYC